MAVVILGLGATRRHATIAEMTAILTGGLSPAQPASSGGLPVVVVDSLRPWGRSPFPAGVRTIEVAVLMRRHPPLRIARLLLYGLPRRATRLLGRGRLASRAGRLFSAYERKVADRVHNRLVAPMHQRLWPNAYARSISRAVGEPIDVILATDPASFTVAAGLTAQRADAGPAPEVGFALRTLATSPIRTA
jgi:hypothetical protein